MNKTRGRGRPKALGPDSPLREVCLKLRRFGLYKETIADILEVSSRTIRDEELRDPDFAAQMEESKTSAAAYCIGKLIENVQAGNQRAIEYYLERILHMYPRQVLEHHGSLDNNVRFFVPKPPP